LTEPIDTRIEEVRTELLSEVALGVGETPPDEVGDLDAREGISRTSRSPLQLAWRRYWRHRGAAVSTVILAIMLLVVLATPLTARYGVTEAVRPSQNQFLPPQDVAWFGTNQLGRDVYSLLLVGVRTSLFIGVASAILSTVIGTAVGSFAGLRGGAFDNVMMRVTDLFLAFPFLVAIVIARQLLGGLSFLDPIIGERTSIRFIIVLFAIFGWMIVARLVRGQVLALKEREFVEASRAAGASDLRIVVAHLLPNSIGPVIVALTLSVIAAVVGESTLSFFGFGPQPGAGSISLGQLVQGAGAAARQGNWWLVVFPCGALVLLAVCINFIGDGLRDAFDPKMDGGH